MQEGPDQRGFACGPRTKQHNHEIAPFQLGLHALPLLTQGFPLHRIAHPIEGLIDGGKVLGSRFPAVTRWRQAGSRSWPGLAGNGPQPRPGQLHQQQHEASENKGKQRLNDPARQIPTQLPVEVVDPLQQGANGDQGQHSQAGDHPQAGASAHNSGIRIWLLG